MKVTNVEDLKSRRMWTAVVAEFVGTLLLVLITCGATYDGNAVQISLSFGFTVATVVWAIGHVSGGHINPSVTMGFIVARRITIVRGLLYIVAQTLGGIVGAALLKGVSASGTPQGTVALATGISVGQGFGVELIVCFVLVFVVFSCVDDQRTDLGGSIPLTVGLAIAISHLWAVRPFLSPSYVDLPAGHPFVLTHLPLDKMAAISQTIFADTFLWMKSFVFWLQFHWSFFLMVQLTKIQHWFR